MSNTRHDFFSRNKRSVAELTTKNGPFFLREKRNYFYWLSFLA
jgi:hypothetical protein